MKSSIALLFAMIVLTLSGISCRMQPQQIETPKPARGALDVEYSRNTGTIPKHEVFEITFRHSTGRLPAETVYANPFFDVAIDVVFTSPSKKQIHVGGFFYGSCRGRPALESRAGCPRHRQRQQVSYHFDKQDLWKARFAPSEPGRWKYAFVFRNVQGQEARGEGSFTCIKGRKPNPGFVRRHPENRFRFVFDDGSPYFPIGLQDCWGDNSGTGSILDQCSMEGPFRTDLKEPPELPPGPMFVRGPANNPQNADVYFRYFSQCGFDRAKSAAWDAFPLDQNEWRDTDGDGIGDNADDDDDNDGFNDQEEIRKGKDPLDRLSFPVSS